MKLATVAIDGRKTWGVVEGDTFLDVGVALASRYADLKAALAAALAGVADARSKAAAIPLARVAWLPVIPNPDKILCVGLNYETHRQETGRAEVGHPTIFSRYANSQTGHMQPIVRPRVSTDLDFEGEVGRDARPHDRLHVSGLAVGVAREDGGVADLGPAGLLPVRLVVQADAQDLVRVRNDRQPRDPGKRDGGSLRPGIGNAGESRSQGRLEVGIARGERNANVQEGVTFDDPPGLPSVDRNGGQLHTSSPF